MSESRKVGVSVRMNAADLRGVKRLAQRVGSRDSDVIRFAVKSTLARLAPLLDTELRGAELLLAVVDAGPEFLRFFEIDPLGLEQLVNDGLDPAQRVDRADIALTVRSIGHIDYTSPLAEGPEAALRVQGSRSNGAASLRRYLHGKYGTALQEGLRAPGSAA